MEEAYVVREILAPNGRTMTQWLVTEANSDDPSGPVFGSEQFALDFAKALSIARRERGTAASKEGT